MADPAPKWSTDHESPRLLSWLLLGWRADLGRVLGESILLVEAGEGDRAVHLPHVPEGHPEMLRLQPNLRVLATRNTADRSIARMDVAIRRRFAFVEVWPELGAVAGEGVDFAQALFAATEPSDVRGRAQPNPGRAGAAERDAAVGCAARTARGRKRDPGGWQLLPSTVFDGQAIGLDDGHRRVMGA